MKKLLLTLAIILSIFICIGICKVSDNSYQLVIQNLISFFSLCSVIVVSMVAIKIQSKVHNEKESKNKKEEILLTLLRYKTNKGEIFDFDTSQEFFDALTLIQVEFKNDQNVLNALSDLNTAMENSYPYINNLEIYKQFSVNITDKLLDLIHVLFHALSYDYTKEEVKNIKSFRQGIYLINLSIKYNTYRILQNLAENKFFIKVLSSYICENCNQKNCYKEELQIVREMDDDTNSSKY